MDGAATENSETKKGATWTAAQRAVASRDTERPATIPPGDPRSIENLGLAWLAGDE